MKCSSTSELNMFSAYATLFALCSGPESSDLPLTLVIALCCSLLGIGRNYLPARCIEILLCLFSVLLLEKLFPKQNTYLEINFTWRNFLHLKSVIQHCLVRRLSNSHGGLKMLPKNILAPCIGRLATNYIFFVSFAAIMSVVSSS